MAFLAANTEVALTTLSRCDFPGESFTSVFGNRSLKRCISAVYQENSKSDSKDMPLIFVNSPPLSQRW